MKYYCFTILSLILAANASIGQVIVQQFSVIHDDRVVGSTSVTRTGGEKNYTIRLQFNATIDFVVKTIILVGQEQALFENGMLKYASILRKSNEKIKVDKSVRRKDSSSYIAYDGEESKSLPITEIRANLLNLLFLEPYDHQKIFSDNLQQFVYVTEISPHIYKIPGKHESYNTYSYHNGVCTSILLNSSLITLVLKRK